MPISHATPSPGPISDPEWDEAHLFGGFAYTVGSAFPGSPASGDFCYRTDRDLEYRYNGTRWLSTTFYRTDFGVTDNLMPLSVSATTSGRMTPWGATDLWLETFYSTIFVSGTNDGSNYWTIELKKYTAGNSPTTVASFNTSADSASTWTPKAVEIDDIFSAATYKQLQVIGTKTGSPANIYVPAAVAYRLVG